MISNNLGASPNVCTHSLRLLVRWRMGRRVLGDLINRAVRHHIKHVDHPEDPVRRPFQIEQVRILSWLRILVGRLSGPEPSDSLERQARLNNLNFSTHTAVSWAKLDTIPRSWE